MVNVSFAKCKTEAGISHKARTDEVDDRLAHWYSLWLAQLGRVAYHKCAFDRRRRVSPEDVEFARGFIVPENWPKSSPTGCFKFTAFKCDATGLQVLQSTETEMTNKAIRALMATMEMLMVELIRKAQRRSDGREYISSTGVDEGAVRMGYSIVDFDPQLENDDYFKLAPSTAREVRRNIDLIDQYNEKVSGITRETRANLPYLINDVAMAVIEVAIMLLGDRKRVDTRSIQAAVRVVFPEGLERYAVSEGTKAVTHYHSEKKQVQRTFPLKTLRQMIQNRAEVFEREDNSIAQDSLHYLGAVLSYVVAEIVEIAINHGIKSNSKRNTRFKLSWDILSKSVFADEDLRTLWSSLGYV
jgi:hypothetical protein